jgi:hypothetical protein
MKNTLIGRDVYLRYDSGPVQHFRAWDVEKFVTSQVEQGRNAKKEEDRHEVSVATEDEYRKEHRR